MESKSRAEIISYNIEGEAICASAARISTTEGNAYEIFEKAKDNPKNRNLIKKVLQSGHKSLIEHAVFTIALWNVSAFVEQFFIESRLASFTIKSRRYVDFTNLGYYIPSDLGGEDLADYRRYMDKMFGAYQAMLDMGIPKEDARFLLPYSFNSNFYCTVNARELAHIVSAIKYGRGRCIPELQDLAEQITAQIKELFPCLLSEIEGAAGRQYIIDPADDSCNTQGPITFVAGKSAGTVALINYPVNPQAILNTAYGIGRHGSARAIEPDSLLKSERPRELEQLSYTFLVSAVTLSGITHLVRHRIQSVIVPPIQGLDRSRYIIPAEVSANADALARYKQALSEAYDMAERICKRPALKGYDYYFALSGNVMDIMTTMNARELMHFTRLRACNRAQWEIRNISIGMLKLLRGHFPELFNCMGPSCYMDGRCPEGNMTCGKISEVAASFGNPCKC